MQKIETGGGNATARSLKSVIIKEENGLGHLHLTLLRGSTGVLRKKMDPGGKWTSPIFFSNYNTFKRTGSGVTMSNFAHDDRKKFYKSVIILS